MRALIVGRALLGSLWRRNTAGLELPLCEPIFSHAMELLLGRALTGRIHPASQDPVAPQHPGLPRPL